MRIFEPHAHMYSRTTDDYERMAAAGIEALVEPAFWLGSNRTDVATFTDYFRHVLDFEATRAEKYGIKHYASIAMNPKEANDLELAQRVVKSLGPFLDHPRCLAVGEVGFDRITDDEDAVMRMQLKLAKEKGLPAQVHLPHFYKPQGLARILAAVEAVGLPPERVLIDHNTEETIGQALDFGCWVGMSIYPVTKLSPERAVAMIQRHGSERVTIHSAADWGPSDPLSVPKTVALMRQKRIPRAEIQRIVWDNPVEFFSQSGKLEVEPE